ncbi:sugar porter family MFS transporter [Bombilactobacillus thymidiniphilus]|uniref:Sugar porter family MFS transporter n=1 Tax=Bombilactobacillus thymidiniphilus TaxID=2923363 RepID=A0ABY4PBP4_9LACO|nr:sugar porter family MFS transporter [Bombilactobacillus thymidiniphilus]UQS83102.1 sugar porter family MFS transporter [Bombilactobacillus thymidiniphilus]
MVVARKISSKFIYFFGSFGGILFGYDIGVMTGALPFLEHDWQLHNAAVIGWITSAVMFGAIFGGALAGQLADRFGRRKLILVAAALFAVGAILSMLAPNHGSYYLIGVRIILGLAVGGASAIVPAYMSEMAPAKLRGRLSGLNQTMICTGMLLSYIMDYLLKNLPANWAWRLMLGLAAVPAVILYWGVLYLPESPRFLLQQHQDAKARAVLMNLRTDDVSVVDQEMQSMNKTLQTHDQEQKTSWLSLWRPRYRPLVIAGVGVAALQQFQGANAIFYYIPLIIQKATGHAASSALLWPVVQGIILVSGSLLFLWIADRLPRRFLLILGGSVMGISFLLPAMVNWLLPNANPLLIVLFLSIYVAFYSFTWAPLTWVITGEIFPSAIRGKAAGVASSCNWIGSWAVGLLFPIMTAALPQEVVFAIFGVICLLGVLFVQRKVPETRGHSLEEIEQQSMKKTGD